MLIVLRSLTMEDSSVIAVDLADWIPSKVKGRLMPKDIDVKAVAEASESEIEIDSRAEVCVAQSLEDVFVAVVLCHFSFPLFIN
jgi:hypothetical protein